MGRSQREKGKRGEREAAEFLRDRGIPARRGQQYAGGPESPDLVTALQDWHIEVKRVEKLNVYESFAKAHYEKSLKVPAAVLMHRRNRSEWMVTLRAEDFIGLLHRASAMSKL